MKTYMLFLFFVLYLFSHQAIAWNQGDFDYKEITANLEPTPGCKNKNVALKQAASDYRYKKNAKVLCQHIGYGWGLAEIIDRGELVCELCSDASESEEHYKCWVKNVTLKCVLTKLGW